MAEAFIEKTEYNQYLSAPDYIDQFYGDKEGISTTKLLSSPLVSNTLDYLFSDFIGLEYANFPNLVSTSKKAFAGCISLKEINFPNLSYVESGLFENCINLKEVYLPKCISVKNDVFNGCTSLEELNLPIYKGSSSISMTFYIHDLDNLEQLYLESLERNIKVENCPKLEELRLSSLSIIGSSYGYLKNLPALETLILDNLSQLYSFAFMSLPNLKYLILPKCLSINSNIFAENVSQYSLPEDVIFSLPEVTYINFQYNGTFKSITLPAITSFNSIYDGLAYNQPYYLGLPNVSIITRNNFVYATTMIKSLSHDIIIDLSNLEVIESYAFNGNYYNSSYGIILRTPKLSEIKSSAFHSSYTFSCLKEINLQNVSILNDDVFKDTENSLNSGINFRNLDNIKEVKSGALGGTKINSDTLRLPNCEKFDFRQGLYTKNTLRCYSLAIRRFDAGSNPGSSYCISNLILPKLSEIITNPDNAYVSYHAPYNAMNIFPENIFSLDTCKQIVFYDGSSIYANGYSSIMYYKKCNLLYIPECLSLKYVYNPSINISYRNMLLNIRELYAPKLQTLENILFRDLHKITISSEITLLNLEYTYGNVSIIDFSQSFSGFIRFQYYSSYSSYCGSYTLSGINLPNFSGYFRFDPDFSWRSYISADRNRDFNIILGENIEGTYIDLYSMIQYFDEDHLKNINTYIQKSIIDNDIYYEDSSYHTESTHANLYLPNCNTINYTIFSSVLTLTSTSINIDASMYFSYHEGKIFNVGGFISVPLLESINIYISYDTLSLSSDIQDPTSLAYNFPNVEIQTYIHELYAPKLSKIKFIFPNEVQQYISMYRACLDFGYDRQNGLTSITLGISEMSDMFNGSFNSDGTFSAYNRWEYLNDRHLKYLSFSNLNGIPEYRFTGGANWSDWTLYLTNAETVNLNNISYISYHGLYIGKLETLSFPNLLYMEGNALSAPNLKFISFPKLQSLGSAVLYSCSKMQILSLPSTCSRFSTNALPSNFEVLDLYYNGVVSGSLQGGSYWYSAYHSSEHTVRVPSAYLSAYKNDAFWGSYLSSFHFNIIAM